MADTLESAPDKPEMTARLLLALVVGQVGMHSAMAGLRMAAPLQALSEGASAWSVGLLLALFGAAPVMVAMKSGRLADKYGYHRPVRIAVGLTATGAALAVASTFIDGWPHIAVLAMGAMLTGAGANVGMLAIQRTAGQAARNSADRVRIFSWLGVAPSLANVVGPVSAGFMIDWAGYRAAFVLMLMLPLMTLWASRQVPRVHGKAGTAARGPRLSSLSLLEAPGMKRLLFVNWLLSACWDVHSFAVPIIGHNYGFNASTIGLILGTFTLSVTLVRMAIPMLVHRLDEVTVVRTAMVGTGLVFALYPLAKTPLAMGALAATLGLALGVTQPMIMSMLHHFTPDNRHGESLAFRSMAINLSSALMPLIFGAVGVAVGAASLFWAMGAAVGAGSMSARGLRATSPRT